MRATREKRADREAAENLEAEFDLLMRRAGIVVPEERRKGTLDVFQGLMKAVPLLHRRRDPGDWTSHVYLMDTVTRAKTTAT